MLDGLPTLKLCVVHGGGYLPSYASRMDHAWRCRPEPRQRIPAHPPSTYLRRMFVDTLVSDEAQLAFLVQQMGADRVVVGTDYPYDMGDDDPVGLIERTTLSDDDRTAILGRTARELPHLDT